MLSLCYRPRVSTQFQFSESWYVGAQNGTAADRWLRRTRGEGVKTLKTALVEVKRDAMVLMVFFHLVGAQNRCQLARWGKAVREFMEG